MTIEDRIKAAQAAVDEAEIAHRVLDQKFRDERNEAMEAVRVKHAPALSAANKAIIAAQAALAEAKEATEPHPWTGKKVYQMQSTGRYSSNTKRVEGVVEMRTRATAFPESVRWGKPEIGTPFVRLLKADGTAGLRFERLGNSHRLLWKLVEGE